ncbi:MAG: aspartate ammonia-lyase [Calditrichaeota bacterium]|nr:aspartate ammonia-lyase [Calditrichota bacterium]
MAKKTRIERDSLGEKPIPAEAYYGIQTQRALENFPVSGLRADPAFIRAYAMIKKAACLANQELGAIDAERASAICQAATEILEGRFLDQFVVDVFQAGAGTSFHMNVNEVIANRALEILGRPRGDYAYLSPNDHVNYGQSTNDTFPTALHLATLILWRELEPVLQQLIDALNAKANQLDRIIKAGRTHLQDALPIRLGQEFRAYAVAFERSVRAIGRSCEELLELAIGGTAVGTGVNTLPGYRSRVIQHLQAISGFPVRPAQDLREAMASRQAVGWVSAALRALALELIRLANDLRLMASGPATGLNEIQLPAVQPGSSIMPGKVNPVLAECLNMIGFQIIGNDTAIAYAIQAGQLELNVMMPLMAHNILQSFRLLINFLPVFTEKGIQGIQANEEQCRAYAERTTALGTILNPIVGYLNAAEIVKESLRTGKSIQQIVREKRILSDNQMEELFNLERLTREPGD